MHYCYEYSHLVPLGDRLGDSMKKQQPYWKLFQSFILLLPEHALPTETTGLANWWHMMLP
jgi:hypothetical protein